MASSASQPEKKVFRRKRSAANRSGLTASPKLMIWISSKSWMLGAEEVMRARTTVRGSAAPVPRKILIPGSISSRASSALTIIS